MVLGERCNENGRNGKRSRGPSPNGHGSPDSSSEDENEIDVNKPTFAAEKIRVGRDYQAVCPELETPEDRRPELMADRALLVWSPTIDISDCKLDEYITVAKDKYGYNGEQALGMLFWHKHDLNRATLDLGNFTPFPDEWTVEDKVLFEQAFQFHGKSFHRIRQMLPDKNIAALVKYYYSWKKTRVRTSLMDRGAPGPQQPGQPRQGSEDGHSDHHISDKDSDNDDKKWSNSRGIRRGSRSRSPSSRDGHSPASGIDTPAQADAGDASSGKYCTVCGILCMTTTAHDAHNLCQTCYNHLRRTGQLRPVGGCGSTGRRQQRFKHRLPRGIYINQDDLFGVAGSIPAPQASERPTPGETMLLVMDREIVSLKRQVQQNKQQISSLKRKCSDGTAGVSNIEELRPGEPQAKINARWHNDELLMAVQGVRKYGRDYAAIAETIGTKTEGHVRSFFASYRRRYNLDAVLREYEAERGTSVTTNTTTTPGDSQVNGHNASNNGSGGSGTEDSSEPASSAPSVAATPTIIKDDKMEVDSEGCALGAPAEQGGAPTTPSKQPKTATK